MNDLTSKILIRLIPLAIITIAYFLNKMFKKREVKVRTQRERHQKL